MRLIPFEVKDSSLLVSWIPSRESSLLWGGRVYDWPITPIQIVERQKKPEVMSFLMVDNAVKIGFIEILKVTNEEYRLCRVIISESAGRGNGYGKILVQLAISYIRENFMAKVVTLAVFEKNESALHCYNSVGFRLTSREINSRFFDGCYWPLLKMEMVL
ncbi:GNAT family N-acetyltransferase [Photobacterium makurazakiensis]|uniref:GNAT family N-acetyltransferase n=1 Tax=Photobacterium makurazakiensis TaxID=2910234 RepID=UPI003D0D29C5